MWEMKCINKSRRMAIIVLVSMRSGRERDRCEKIPVLFTAV